MEELYVNKDPIKVGDRVHAPKHGIGKVLAIVGDNAWVQTEVRDYPLTFDVKKLRKAVKPRRGAFIDLASDEFWGGVRGGTIYWDVPAIELTDEVRERVKDLL